MGRMARGCIQSLLKVVNSGLGMLGIAMILYALWMLRVWLSNLESNAPTPWFIYTILGLGVLMCVITCSGYIAAETASGCCLYIYMAFVFLLFVMEAAVTVDVFLNSNWEEDFPEDPTENLNQLKGFITENFDLCKWIGFTVVALQGLSILFAVILKALGAHPLFYDSDDDYLPYRVPLLKNYVPPQSYVGNDQYRPRHDPRNSRIDNKASR